MTAEGNDPKKSSSEVEITPTRFETLIVNYPCCCCLSWLSFAIVFLLVTGAFMATKKLSFDQRGVWDVRSHEVQKQFDAFMLARSEIKTSDSVLQQYTTRSKAYLPLHLLYFSESGDDNFLTVKNLEWMKDIEAKLFSATKFDSKCVLQHGVDTAQDPIMFTSLNSNTNIVTADKAPEDGATVVFSGQSSVLSDGGLYIIRRSTANSFKIMFRNSNLIEVEVQFSTAGDISSGARFLPTTSRCSAAQSILSYAYPAAAAQKQSMCNGFVTSPSNQNGIAVLMTVCGCNASSVVRDRSQVCLPNCSPQNTAQGKCQPDCSSQFGKSPFCTSSAYVAPDAGISQAAVDANLVNLCPNLATHSPIEKVMYSQARQNILPSSWGCSSTNAINSASMARSVYWFGGPMEGYTRIAGDAAKDQMDDMTDWTKETFRSEIVKINKDANADADGTARVVIMAPFMIRMSFSQIMLADGMLAMGSIWFVWMWTWCSTGSLLLAAGCIFETFMSLPMAMATWGLVGQEWLGFLTVMMIFVILGIGADDVFVLVDAWKQSGQQGFGDDLQKRFSWAYRRARDAMAVTTVTTFFGFFAAGLSNVPSISGFGYFAALVVFWDYILCITFFASLTVVYHKYFEGKNACCGGRFTAHMGCCPCECLGMEEPRPMWKKPKIMVPFVALVVLGIVVAIFLPFFGCVLIGCALIFVYSILSVNKDTTKGRPVELFFREKYFPFTKNHRLKMILPMVIIFLVCIVLIATLLRLPTKEEPFLSENHPLQRYLDSGSEFGTSGALPLTWIYVVFGIDKKDALDRSGVDYQQPGTGWSQNEPDKPLGKVQYSNAAQQAMVSAAGQNEIISLCDSIRDSPSVAIYDSDCQWLVHDGVGYPRFVPQKSALVSNGKLSALNVVNSKQYFESAGSDQVSLSDISTGFCATGVYCFMYTIRDYIVSFCNPSLGLKAKFVNRMAAVASAAVEGAAAKSAASANVATKFAPLCVDAKNQIILGGTSAWPSSDLDAIVASEGFHLYEADVLRYEHKANGMDYDDYQRRSMTNKVVSDGKLKFAFIGINGTIPLDDFPYSEQKKLYDEFVDFFNARLTVNSNAFFSSFIFNWMFITEALLTNTIQSMCLGVCFAWIVATCMTWNFMVAITVVSSVVMVVVIAVGFISLMGWKLDIIEAIVLIVIVGISVDYSVHVAHAYNHASESKDKSNAEIREEKCYAAVSSMGISLLSGLATSMGAAVFLWFCQISFFRKFGNFLMITLIISFAVTFLYLIPLLLLLGPVKGMGVLPPLVEKCRKTCNRDADKVVPCEPS